MELLNFHLKTDIYLLNLNQYEFIFNANFKKNLTFLKKKMQFIIYNTQTKKVKGIKTNFNNVTGIFKKYII